MVQVFLNQHPSINMRLKNFTDFHSYKENVDLLGKIDQKLKNKGNIIQDAIVTDKDTKITAKIQGKIDKITVIPVPAFSNAAGQLPPTPSHFPLAPLPDFSSLDLHIETLILSLRTH